MEEEKKELLEKMIGYRFKNTELIEQALTHSSYANERRINKLNSNERLEYLGDAVLELVSSEFLFFEYPKLPEGELSKLRAAMVCEQALAGCAAKLSVGDALFLGKGEDSNGGRKKASVTSDALEAIIGALYLDGGLPVAKKFILDNIMTAKFDVEMFQDNKSKLQELVQGNAWGQISYEIIGESGPEHKKEFVVVAKIADKPYGKGKGRNKKTAEQMAAYETLKILKAKNGV